jgi:hypothetical protein
VTLTILRASCDNGRTCPNINSTDQGTLVVQGYPATTTEARAMGLDVNVGSLGVWIPISLVPEIVTTPISSSVLRVTESGAVLIVGSEVTDPGTLVELDLPDGETAIEVPAGVLPFLKVAAHAR